MSYDPELEINNIRSALTRLETFVKKNPTYADISSLQDDMEMLQSAEDDVIDSHIPQE